MSFIKKLFRKRSNYNDPDQATMQENSLEKLSSGIYTEGERFIFELLQNAVDAHNGDDCLNVDIRMQDGYLIFMHNGDEFTEADIESICFVGRKGDKTTNAKKIGYKGIGFKSVFGISSKVFIHTGFLCFRFDKDYWTGYWSKNWVSALGPMPENVSDYTMPWQVIPIESEVPVYVDEGNANVATYIAIDSEDEEKLAGNIMGLMRSCRFLIFLKDKNIKMSFTRNGRALCSIEKQTQNGEVVLSVNGHEESRWMVYQNYEVPLNLTEEQKRRIEKHKSTPDKLKNATSFDLSFAIAIENGKLKKTEDAVFYTYLPTSYRFGEGLPFLVNANFITDEGRQHLDVDAEWNKVIIKKVPEEYLRWISTLSRSHPNYYEILPKKSYGNVSDLERAYAEAMTDALKQIAFIPTLKNNNLLKVEEAFVDRIGLTTQIRADILLGHINRKNATIFTEKSLIANKGVTILKDYGVATFEKDDLKELFNDKNAFENLTVEEDVKLVKFLHDFFVENKSMHVDILSSTKFLLDKNGTLRTPEETQFPSDFKNEFSEDAIVLDYTILEDIGGTDSEIYTWLKQLGVKEASDISVIEQVICRSDYVTPDNAIEVGRFLFKVFKRENFFDKISSYTLSNIKLLTKKGTLIKAENAYLGSEYRPDIDLEPVYDEDIYINESYIEDKSERDRYKDFFGNFGVPHSLKLTVRKFKCEDCRNIAHLNQIIEKSKKEYWTSWSGYIYYFDPKYFLVSYAPLIGFHTSNHQLCKIVWTSILASKRDTDGDKIEGKSGYIDRMLSYSFYSDGNLPFIDGMLNTIQKLPAVDGTMRLSREMFYNSEINKSLAGKYLPIIDVDCEIDESWNSALRLKRDLTISDLLAVLTSISEDETNIEENKDRICKIYERIVEIGIGSSSVREQIKSWAENEKILSKEGKFVSPSKLSHITLEGFRTHNQVYISKCKGKNNILKLLSLMGVRIITEDNVNPTFEGKDTNTDVPTRLLSVLPALAVLKRDCNQDKSYQESKAYLQKKIENTVFYQCESIALAYDNSGDTISKITFAQDGKFYFTGKLHPAKIEPLLQPLCSYLGISGKEHEMFVILTEPSFSGIVEYLKDKEYNVSPIEEEMLPAPIEGSSGTSVVSVGGQIGGGIDKSAQIADSNEAKTLVLAKLETEGFDVSNVDADWSVIEGVKKDGVSYPLVVKSCKNWDHKLLLNPTEWKELFKPNSMLWLHLGNRVVVPIKAHELFTYQDKLTITFDTVNLLMDDRIEKIMEVMRYFNNVHLDVATLNPDQHRAERIEEYLFNPNNPDNSDLAPAGID